MRKIVFLIGFIASVGMIFIGFKGIQLEKELEKELIKTIPSQPVSSLLQEMEKQFGISSPERLKKEIRKTHAKTIALLCLGFLVLIAAISVFKYPVFSGLSFLVVLVSHSAIYNIHAKLLDITLMAFLLVGAVFAFKIKQY